jgi:hypothetical protein
MNKTRFFVICGVLAGVGAGAFIASAQGNQQRFRTRLTGFAEVPAVSSTGHGDFRLSVNPGDSTLSYELQYENLEGATTLFAHVHIGQTSVNGGIAFFLCGGGGKPACPNTSGSVSGTIVVADIIGPTAQGVASGEMAEVLRGLRAGAAYVNVHTNKHAGGEIRGQIGDAASDK